MLLDDEHVFRQTQSCLIIKFMINMVRQHEMEHSCVCSASKALAKLMRLSRVVLCSTDGLMQLCHAAELLHEQHMVDEVKIFSKRTEPQCIAARGPEHIHEDDKSQLTTLVILSGLS